MNIIFGGSFNPVTKAHILIAGHLVNKFNPERLVFLPVGNDYDKPELVEFEHRFNMLKLISGGKIDVSDYEGKHEYKGTYNTLNNLPYDDMYFVIGNDNLRSISSWNNIFELIRDYKFIIVNRPGCILDLSIFKGFEDRFIIVDDIEIDMSSSDYRKTKNPNLLDREVSDYIEKHQLYK